MTRYCAWWFRAVLAALALSAPAASAGAAAPPKFALLLANARYGLEPLRNPLADADLVGASLRQTGFQVETHTDLGRSDFYAVVNAFVERLPAGSVSFIYFAGHGMQIRGSNYLIPVDMVPTSESGVASRAFALNVILEKIQAAKSVVNIVVLDACRNNPFKPEPAGTSRGYEDMGLAKVVSPRGTVIAYSTAPGQLAEDGSGAANSPYSQTLADELRHPGLTVEQVLKNVGINVRKATLDDQQPWFESSLVDDFYFEPPAGVRIALAPKPASGSKPAPSASRGIDDTDTSWYADLSAKQWSDLDQHIGQHMLHMSVEDFQATRRRADAGDVVAQTLLGRLYLNGAQLLATNAGRPGGPPLAAPRIAPDNRLSAYWLGKAAAAGFLPARTELGKSGRQLPDGMQRMARIPPVTALDFKQGTQVGGTDWDALVEGRTTKAAVMSALGPPQQTVADGENTIYVYRYSVISATAGAPNHSQTVSLTFNPAGLLLAKSRHSSDSVDSNPLTGLSN